MTSELTFDLFRAPYFGGAQHFLFCKVFDLSTPWILILQFNSFWAVFLELVGHSKKLLKVRFPKIVISTI